MYITKVELENIKSHAHEIFNFERGTTAITGANGAGKTTIIEAVAWTLFDLLDYKKDDFARRGAKGKGVARVVFESSLDEREYLVYRDTANGYYIYDPQLKAKIADKKEEVTRFLRQHLGVEAGTDLETLFRRAIGVPQGTFTAIFLESATERKKAFDKLLKVEEYRQGAEKLRETANFLKTKIAAVREKIARAEGELSRLDQIETDYKNFGEQIETLSATLKNLAVETAEKREIVEKFDTAEKKVDQLKVRRDKFQADAATAEVVLKQKETEKTLSLAAAQIIETVKTDYEAHTAALAQLKNLEAERVERDRLKNQIAKIEAEIEGARAAQKGCGDNLQKAIEAGRKIVELKPQAEEQIALEKQRETLRGESAEARAAEKQIETYEGKLNGLRTRLGDIQKKIKETETAKAGAANLADLQKRETEITGEIAKLRATLERDEQFERDILEGLLKNHFCPILSQKCLNLETGKASDTTVAAQTKVSKTQIASLETEARTLSEKISAAREAEKISAALPTLYQLKTEVTAEGTRLREEQEEWRKRAENSAKIKTEIAEIETKLKNLDEPRAKIRAYEIEAAREAQLREKIAKVEKELARLETEKKDLSAAALKYETLDAKWKTLTDDRDRTARPHREFISNETAAKLLPEREQAFETAAQKLTNLKTELERASAEFETASKDYDRERHLSEKAHFLDAEKRLTEIKVRLEEIERRKSELNNELKRLQEIRAQMQTEFAEKDKLEKVAETTDFIRETLKEAAPRVARNYVHYVSLEANQMFREISGSAERTLKWTEDYGIVLEENGYERPFINLSGGEQMAAALSVRLALLKQLSDIRLAFFDEPTTNMDAERRENLATQIGNIKHFDQLFVISHDDTFEGYVDNVISIGNSN